MPDEASGMMGSPAGAGTPPGAPSAGQPPQQGQATGPTPATMRTPNSGAEGAALAALAVIAQRLQQLLVVLPVGSDAARDVREAVNKIAKHVPPGGVSQGVQMTEAQKNLMTQQQQGPQVAAMRAGQMGGGGAPQGASGPPSM